MNAPTSSPAPDTVQRSNRLDGYLNQDAGNELLRAEAFDAALAANLLERAQGYLAAADLASASWKYRSANLLLAQGEPEPALAALQGLRATVGEQPAVIQSMATALFALGRYSESAAAMGPLVRGIASSPRPPGLVELWLQASHQAGELEEAWAWLATRVAQASDLPASVAAIGSLLALDAGHLQAAEALADAALHRLPQAREALVAKGTAVLARRDAAAAERYALAALQPREDGRARSLLAFARMLAGQTETALRDFELAVELIPQHVGTWQGLGWLRLCTGDMAGARVALQSALERDRNFADNHGALAVLDAIDGRPIEASRGIQVAKRLDPRCASARYAEAILSGEAADQRKMRQLADEVIVAARS